MRSPSLHMAAKLHRLLSSFCTSAVSQHAHKSHPPVAVPASLTCSVQHKLCTAALPELRYTTLPLSCYSTSQSNTCLCLTPLARPNGGVYPVQLWIDTCGHAATYPVLRLAGARVAAYVHYPTISTDMLSRVRRRDSTYNNSAAISSSPTVSFLKLLYYIAYAGVYGWLGGFANVAMVNSSWTGGHVETIWWGAQRRRPPVVWPPCDVARLSALPLKRAQAQPSLVSVAQFRPEKNHECAPQPWSL